MSKTNDIAAALQTRLETIRLANGYPLDLGANVYRGRAGIARCAIPALSLFELEDQVEEQKHDAIVHLLLPIVIEAVAPCSPDHPARAAHDCIAAIKRAIFSGDQTWGGLATHTRYIGRNITPPEPGTSIVTATVEIRIGCVENLADP